MTTLPRYSLWLSLLRWSLYLGAAYDAVMAALMAFAPDFLARTLGVPAPEPRFYLWVIAVILAMLAAFYVLAAYDPASYRGNILVAIGGRLLAGGVLFVAARTGGFPGLLPAASADLAFGLAHAVFFWPIRR